MATIVPIIKAQIASPVRTPPTTIKVLRARGPAKKALNFEELDGPLVVEGGDVVEKTGLDRDETAR